MSDTPPQGYNSGLPADRAGRRRLPGRRLSAAIAAVVVIAVCAGVVDHRARGYYEFSPGDAPLVTAAADCVQRGSAANLTLPGGGPCARLVVPSSKASTVDGRLYMVDVLVGPASPQDYALHELGLLGRVHPGDQLIPAAEVLGTTPASELGCQDAQEMTGSTQAAAVAALSRLGYHVGVDQLGAQVVQVNPGSAAARAGLRCNDLVTAVGTAAVHSVAQLAAAVRAHRPGSKVVITVQRTEASGGARRVALTAVLTGVPAMPAAGGEPATPADPTTSFLGVATQDDVRYDLPFPVSVEVGDIGGPSAGLALTLGLLDVLSQGRLTGGHTVAATGTIAPDGTVGDVGGVTQKTIAVRRAGAQLFLVPEVELATARAQAGSMTVEAVGSLGQALDDLRRLGGTLVPPGGTTASAAGPAAAH